jgi:cytochrome c oxidase cbb3-type subunit III
MMRRLLRQAVCLVPVTLALLVLQGCDHLPGKPKPGPEVVRPDAVLDFPTLYQQNCAACHGPNGQNGSSYPLANPEYQALIDDSALRTVIAQGRPGSLMPAFAIEAGGTLTDAQVDVLVKGMRSAWGHTNAFAGATPPPYSAAGQGNPGAGEQVYATYCASCHGSAAAGSAHPGKAGSITSEAFLALITDQALRTTIIAGRPDIGQPDWRNDVAGKPMSDQEVTGVVAWLASRRQSTVQNAAADAPAGSSAPSAQGKRAAAKNKEN